MRPDGRTADELRPVAATLGELDRADGSGRFAFGATSVLASFSGPLEVRLRDEQISQATLEILHRPLSGVSSTASRALTTTLESVFTPLLALHAFPRSLVQIVVQSLSPAAQVYPGSGNGGEYGQDEREWEEDGEGEGGHSRNTWPPAGYASTKSAKSAKAAQPVSAPTTNPIPLSARAAAINATTLSAIHAGSIGLRAVPLACALSLGVDGELVLDPTAEEEVEGVARFAFGWAFGVGIGAGTGVEGDKMDQDYENREEEVDAELVWVEAEGSFTRDQFNDARDTSLAACRHLLAFTKEELGAYFGRGQAQ